MKVFILFGLLGLASGVLVGCRQSQLPLPVLRFLPASSTLNIQTAVPFSNTTGAGNWNGQQDVTTSGGTPLGIAGSDPVSSVHWFSWEIPYSTATAQNKADEIANNYLTPALGYGPWVVSGYNAWITAAATGAIASGSTASAGTGKATLQALVRALNSITSGLGSATLSYPGADPSYAGWDIALFVMKIPPPVTAPVVARFIATVTIVPTSLANQVNNGAGNVGRESSYFAWKDIYLGQSLASAAHIIAQYCEVFFTSAPKPLDVMFSVDNSGSMGSWQAAVAGLGDAIQAILATSGIDWRIGLTTTAHYVAYSPGTCTATSCGETGTYTCRYFSQDINAVKNWLTSGRTSWIGAGGTCGTGTEKIMYCAQIMLSPVSTTYNNAQSFMPRTPQTVGSLAPNSAFRQATNVLTVYLGDADDQFYSDAASATGIQAFLSFFNGIRTAFNGGFFMAGIICPATQACGETQRSNRVVRGVLSQYPGAAIGDITSVASIQTTIRQVFNSIVATSSPYVLTQSAAIGASVQVLLDASNVLGPCNNSDNQIPRSRQNGFDIEQNTVILFGGCRPSADGRPLVVNYYYWVITQCGDGIVQNDGVTGEQCDPPGACCDSQCRFVTGNNVPCTAGSSCGNGTNFCNAFGVCQATTCPDYPPSQGAPNYCTVALGCVNGACAYQNRTCLPLNCNKRICDRTVNNSNIPGLLGDCVLISAEQGYICDTDYCILDACGWCNGDNTTCQDCAGIPNGNNVVDICGICNKIGAPLQCCSCVPGQESICGPGVPLPDACNVCGGDGLSCKNCATTPGGLVGLDACGVCGGDGLSCGPTYNFQVTIPAGVTSANGDLCIDINASVTGILNTMLGKSTNQYSVTCTPKDSCDITIDPLCFYGQQMFIVSVQQVVFAPTVLSDSGLLALLLTNGLLTGTTLSIPSEIPACDATCTAQIRADVNFCPLAGCPTTAATSASGTATSVTGTGATTAATGTGAATTATSSTGSNTNPASGSFNVAITFTSSDIAATLNQVQLNTLAQSTILQLISDGSLTGSSSDYTATTTVNADGTVTISIQPLITATNPTGAWPGGNPPASGTTVHPPFCGGQTPLCPSGGSGTYTAASSSSSSATHVSSGSQASGASSILLSIAVLLLQ